MLRDHTSHLKALLFSELKQCVNDLDEKLPSDVQDQIQGQNYEFHNHIRSGRPGDHSVYDTGELYRSIQGVNNILRTMTEAPDNVYEAIVGTDTDYATYVHEGGWHIESIPARPFLTDTLETNKKDYFRMIEKAVSSAFNQFSTEHVYDDTV